MGSDFCISTFGTLSYCKTWAVDSCGRSICQGGPELTNCGMSTTTSIPLTTAAASTSLRPSSTTQVPATTTTRPTTASTTRPSSTTLRPTTTTVGASTDYEWMSYLRQGCGIQRQNFCQSRISQSSYCMTWSKDTCDRSRCHGDTRTIWPACTR
jgi:hypothetical protein